MIQVKICGLTAPEEVRAVNEAGAVCLCVIKK